MSVPLNRNGAARRKVRAQVLAEETHCHLCGEPVDKTLTMAWGQHGPRCKGDGCPGCVPHELRPEVDELIPREHGGDPLDRSNCRLSHRRCNRDKYIASKRPAADPDAFPLSDWGTLLDGLLL